VELCCRCRVLYLGLDRVCVVGFEKGAFEVEKGDQMHGGAQHASRGLLRKGSVSVEARAFGVKWAAAARDAGNVGTHFSAGFALATRPLVITWEVFEPVGDANCVVVLLLSQLVQTKLTVKSSRVARRSTLSGVITCITIMTRNGDLLAAIAVKERVRSCSRTAAPAT
jgi:hypothetical protein